MRNERSTQGARLKRTACLVWIVSIVLAMDGAVATAEGVPNSPTPKTPTHNASGPDTERPTFDDCETLYYAVLKEVGNSPLAREDGGLGPRGKRVAFAARNCIRKYLGPESAGEKPKNLIQARGMLDALARIGANPNRPATEAEVKLWIDDEIERIFSPGSTESANLQMYRAVRETLDKADEATLVAVDARLRAGRTIRDFYGADLAGSRWLLESALASSPWTNNDPKKWGMIDPEQKSKAQIVVDDLLPDHKRYLLSGDRAQARKRLAKGEQSVVMELIKLLDDLGVQPASSADDVKKQVNTSLDRRLKVFGTSGEGTKGPGREQGRLRILASKLGLDIWKDMSLEDGGGFKAWTVALKKAHDNWTVVPNIRTSDSLTMDVASKIKAEVESEAVNWSTYTDSDLVGGIWAVLLKRKDRILGNNKSAGEGPQPALKNVMGDQFTNENAKGKASTVLLQACREALRKLNKEAEAEAAKGELDTAPGSSPDANQAPSSTSTESQQKAEKGSK